MVVIKNDHQLDSTKASRNLPNFHLSKKDLLRSKPRTFTGPWQYYNYYHIILNESLHLQQKLFYNFSINYL